MTTSNTIVIPEIGISAYYTGRALRYALLFCLVVSTIGSLNAQRDTSVLDNGPLRWLQVEKSFGIVTEMDFANGAMGLSISRGKFIRGTQRAMAGTTYYAGYAYDTDHQLSYATFGATIGFFKRKFGVCAAAKGLYYIRPREQVFCVRPEIGVGFPKANLLYGYTFLTEKSELSIPVHSVTLYVYFGLHSSRTRMY